MPASPRGPRSSVTRSLVGGAVATLPGSPALAQNRAEARSDTTSDPSLSSLTATGRETAISDLPVVADTTGPEEFSRLLPATTPDALRTLPSVLVPREGGAALLPRLRGFSGSRNVLLVDGVRLNNSVWRADRGPGWNPIDVQSLDRLELVRGASPILYGSDPAGGTLQGFTRSRERFEASSGADGHAFYRYSTAEDAHSSRADFGGNLGEKFGLAGGLSLREAGDLRGGDGTGLQHSTGLSEWAADAQLQYRFTPNTRIVYGHQTVDLDDVWRIASTTSARPWHGTRPGTDPSRIGDAFRNLDYLRLDGAELGGFIDDVRAGVSFQQQREDENRLRSDLRREIDGTEVETIGTTLALQSPTGLGRWTYGMDFYHDWVDSRHTRYAADGSVELRRIQGPVADGSGYDLLGAYVQDQLPLFHDRLEILGGGRYQLASADVGRALSPATGAPVAFDDSWDALVGSGRALWHLDDQHRWSVFGGISQGYRAPNLSDLTRLETDDRGAVEVPGTGLRPEEFLTLEGGVRGQLGRLTAEAAWHDTSTDGMIVSVPSGQTTSAGEPIFTRRNAGDGTIRGLEVSGSYAIAAEWTVWANYTWLKGDVETPTGPGGAFVNEPASRIMPDTLNLGLRYAREDGKFWAEFVAMIVTRQDRLSSADRFDLANIPPDGTPGYEVFHLRAGWRPVERFTLTAALENLTDADYRIHGSGLNEPGLNLVIAGDLKF